MNLKEIKEKFIAEFFQDKENLEKYNKKFEEVLALVVHKDIANKVMKTYLEEQIQHKLEAVKFEQEKYKEILRLKKEKEKQEKENLKIKQQQEKELLKIKQQQEKENLEKLKLKQQQEKELLKLKQQQEKENQEKEKKKQEEDLKKLKNLEKALNKDKAKQLKSFDEVFKIESEEELERALELMQEKYYIINRNGKVYILSYNETNKLTFTEIQSFHYFFKHLNYTEQIDKYKKQIVYLTNLFLHSPNTKRITEIIFDPRLPYGYQSGKFNVWKGFKYKPVEGNVYPFLKLLEVNCNKDVEAFEYFLNYLAFCVQYPHKNPRTAIAIVGDQGTGKGTLITDTICALTDNSIHIESINQLIGEFNGHLTDAFFICLDEASFGGDIKEANRLKTFISENKRMINDKSKTAFSIDCYSKTFILSNNDYIVNVEQGDRRYVVLRASDELKGNFKWFDSYQKWLQKGGYNYIMHYLLERDISDFNPLEIPQTRTKIDLQLKSADLPTKFLFDLLAGNITFQNEMISGNRIYRTKIYDEFVDYCKKYHHKNYIATVNEFNKVIVKAFDYDKKPHWRQNWKDKTGYYFEIKDIADCQLLFSQNLFKTTPENIFFNYQEHINKIKKEEEFVF